MNDILLSIIIPVFNVEEYITYCIDSIFKSGFDERCELILVDDGSTDKSREMCDTYASKNVKVIHQKNSGPSAARNSGLTMARGFYVTFVDSDDYIAEKAITNILKALPERKTDLVFMQGDKVYPDGKIINIGDDITRKDIEGKSKEEVLKFLKSRKKFAGSACTKLYRKSFLTENTITFPNDRRCGEDLLFVTKCIYYAKSYGALDFSYYQYRQARSGSRTSTMTAQRYMDIFLYIEEASSFLTVGHKAINEAATRCMSFVAYEYALQIWKLGYVDATEHAKLITILKKYRWVLKYAGSSKVKIIRLMLCLTGYRITSLLLMKAKKIAAKRL